MNNPIYREKERLRKMTTGKEREYVEVGNITNKLMYLGPGSSLLEVDFDINGEPHIQGIDGAAYWVGIPEEDEKRIVDEIKSKYPHGFHSRSNMGLEWLEKRLEELAANHSVTIREIEPYGCLMVDGNNYDAYKVEIEHKMKSTVYVAMTALFKRFVVFRPYVQYQEFGDSENIGAFQYEEIPIDSRIYKTIFFEEEIVSYREYSYEGDKLKGEEYGFKNNKSGFIKESRFGKFMVAGGVGYSS